MAAPSVPLPQNGQDMATLYVQSSSATASNYDANPTGSSAAPSQLPGASTTDSSPTNSLLDTTRSPRSPSLLSTSGDSILAGSTVTSLSAASAGAASASTPSDDLDVPEPILEALRSSKERLFMLKLGETMESLIKERSPTRPHPRTTLTPSSTYHRLLIHKCCNYHRVTPEVDQVNKTINLIVTIESRIPARRIRDLVPPDTNSNGSAPTFKIMRRNTPEQRSKSRNMEVPSSSSSATEASPNPGTAPSTESGSPPSANGTTSTDPTDDDDQEDPVLRSLGLPSRKPRGGNGTHTPRKTIEEREAEYNEARNRIFMDFEEKERLAAKMREDREREREVTEMHRKLAEEEDAANAQVYELPRIEESPAEFKQQFLAANAHLQIRPATTGPGEHAGPMQLIRGVPSPAAGPGRDIPHSTMYPVEVELVESGASMVSYPSLYDADSTRDVPNVPPQPRPQQPPAPQPYSLNVSAPPYDPNASHYSSPHTAHPAYAFPPYNIGMPPMNPGPPVAMPNFGYVPQQPHQPYPYYSQPGPPPPGWMESQSGYSQPPPMDGPGVDGGYGFYPPPHAQHPQGPFWPQSPQGPMHHPPVGGDMRQGPIMNPSYPINGAPPNFQQFYNNNPPQQPFPSQQRNGFSSQQQQSQFHPNQRQPMHPGQSSQRQLWTPDGPAGSNRRDQHPRNSMSGSSRGQQGRGGPPQANGSQRGPPRGTPPRDPREAFRDHTSLMATPMSQAGSTRSRNSSISTTASAAAYRQSLNFPPGDLPPLMVRSTDSAPGISLVSVPPGWHEKRRSGSLSGSVSENISVVGDDPGTRTPLDETASMSSSISSASVRTYTSTSSKHPSLPARPDWVIYPSASSSVSGRSSHRGGRSGSSSSSSNPTHSRTHSFQSTGRSPYIPQSTDFPPLPGPMAVVHHPPKDNVWANPRPALVSAPPANRFDEDESKFARPAPKGSAQLFDPKGASKMANAAAAAAVAARAATPVGDKLRAVDEALAAVTDGIGGFQLEAPPPGSAIEELTTSSVR